MSADKARSPRATHWVRRLCTTEAILALFVAGFLRRVVPIGHWKPLLGTTTPASPGVELELQRLMGSGHKDRLLTEIRVSSAIRRANCRIGYRANCLDQAIAATIMLRTRRLPSAVVIGIQSSQKADTQAEPWGGHAWLVGQGGLLLGGEVAHEYTPTLVFVQGITRSKPS